MSPRPTERVAEEEGERTAGARAANGVILFTILLVYIRCAVRLAVGTLIRRRVREMVGGQGRHATNVNVVYDVFARAVVVCVVLHFACRCLSTACQLFPSRGHIVTFVFDVCSLRNSHAVWLDEIYLYEKPV